MRGEASKRAVQEIEKHSFYATTSESCRRALRADTPEAYTRALSEIVNSPNRSGEYAVNIGKAESALKQE